MQYTKHNGTTDSLNTIIIWAAVHFKHKYAMHMIIQYKVRVKDRKKLNAQNFTKKNSLTLSVCITVQHSAYNSVQEISQKITSHTAIQCNTMQCWLEFYQKDVTLRAASRLKRRQLQVD